MNIQITNIVTRLEYLGLPVLSNSIESFLSDPARKDETLLESLYSFVDIEYCLRKERSARTRIKVSGMPVSQSLSGVAVSVDSITAELPWFPDLKVRVR